MNYMHINLHGSGYYTTIQYPAGERQVRLNHDGIVTCKEATEIGITANIHNSDDIIDLALLVDAVNRTKSRDCRVDLSLPYLPYARADRAFGEGDCGGLSVFSTILHGLDVNTVATLDVHSKVAIKEIPSIINVGPEPFIESAISSFAVACDSRGVTVLFPDEGAANRYKIESFGSNVGGYNVSAVSCTKKRHQITGKLLGFTIPPLGDIVHDNILIVDDICDGGGTFNGIADLILRDYHRHSLGLYVTHGIFSAGFHQLNRRFLRIYCTDSMGIEYGSKDVKIFSCHNHIRKTVDKVTHGILARETAGFSHAEVERGG